MATRLILLSHAATRRMREGAFPDPDEPIDAGGLAKAQAWKLTGPAPTRIVCGPDAAARGTAEAARLDADIEPSLADADSGDWRGQAFADLYREAAEAFAAWIADPGRGAPGGESLDDVRRRVGPWLDAQAGADGAVLAVTSASVVRAVLCHALDLPTASALRIDIAPLTTAVLSFNRVWRLQSLGG